jgi:sugar/nucleoside kinase (ribokinase family)
MTTIDYLILGHIAHDRTPDGPRLGGTVSYSAVVAQALGLNVGIVTSAHPDDPVLKVLPDVQCHLIPAKSSTIFVNTYDEQGNRKQVIEGQANVLTYADIPESWRDAPIVHLGPIAREITPTMRPKQFPNALVGITPQGFMRDWDDSGRVFPVPWAHADETLAGAVTILSDEDLGHSAELEAEYAARAKYLIVTRGYKWATLYCKGTPHDIIAPDIAALRHPTGAGDTFAASFLAMMYRNPGDWLYALEAAVIIASTYVETDLPEGVPPLETMQVVLEHARVQGILAT